MNRRIRKKREKQQLARAIRELVALAEKRQQKRQEAIDRFLTAYSAYLAKQGGAERGTPCSFWRAFKAAVNASGRKLSISLKRAAKLSAPPLGR